MLPCPESLHTPSLCHSGAAGGHWLSPTHPKAFGVPNRGVWGAGDKPPTSSSLSDYVGSLLPRNLFGAINSDLFFNIKILESGGVYSSGGQGRVGRGQGRGVLSSEGSQSCPSLWSLWGHN